MSLLDANRTNSCGNPLTVGHSKPLRHEILTLGHNDVTVGHLGTFKTYKKFRLRFYWRGMFNNVQHTCRTCVHCAMKKRPLAAN